jgi:hypothetical protein
MSKLVTNSLLFIFLLMATSTPVILQSSRPFHPGNGGGFTWSQIDLMEESPSSNYSPNRRMLARFDGADLAITLDGNDPIRMSGVAPASLLWNPRGTSVAVNHGDGSGQISSLSLISQVGGRGLRVIDVESEMKSYFVRASRCSISPASVSVEAQGWSGDGRRIWVNFESWDRHEFCDNERLFFALYDVASRRIVATMSLEQTLARFCGTPGFRRRFEPNCDRRQNRAAS